MPIFSKCELTFRVIISTTRTRHTLTICYTCSIEFVTRLHNDAHQLSHWNTKQSRRIFISELPGIAFKIFNTCISTTRKNISKLAESKHIVSLEFAQETSSSVFLLKPIGRRLMKDMKGFYCLFLCQSCPYPPWCFKSYNLQLADTSRRGVGREVQL